MHTRLRSAIAFFITLFTTLACEQPPGVTGQVSDAQPVSVPAPNQPTDFPLPVDMAQAQTFVKIGFGSSVSGQPGFQSTEFLTPRLGTAQAAALIRLVPEYDRFHGDPVATALLRFSGRVSGVQFGREGSPVLYIDLPYWTGQREGSGAVTPGASTRIGASDHQKLVEELHRVFVDELNAAEFSSDPSRNRTVRVWWHH